MLASDAFGWRRASRLAGRACASLRAATLLAAALRSTVPAGVTTGRHCVVPANPFAPPPPFGGVV